MYKCRVARWGAVVVVLVLAVSCGPKQPPGPLIPVDPDWRRVLLLLAALPTGSLVFVLASQNDTYVRRATGIILGSTLASVVTLSWVLSYLGV